MSILRDIAAKKIFLLEGIEELGEEVQTLEDEGKDMELSIHAISGTKELRLCK